MRKCKRALSLLLTLAMMLSMLCITASAQEPPAPNGANLTVTAFESRDPSTPTAIESSIYSVTLSDGTVVEAEAEDGVFVLVKDGAQYDIEVGTVLTPGSELIEVTADETYSEMGKFMNMAGQTATYYYRSALYVNEYGVNKDKTIPQLLTGSTYSAFGISGGEINSYGDFFNGIQVDSTEYDVSDLSMEFIGDGANDFQGEGAAILGEGDAVLNVDGVEITTAGVIRTGLAVKENAVMNVTNSVIYSQESTSTQEEYDALVVPMMKRTPFALGLEGVVRATNVLGAGRGVYTDSLFVSTGWGVLSTDSGRTGTHALEVKDTMAGIGTLVALAGEPTKAEADKYTAVREVNGKWYGFTMEGSGYVAYADAGVYDTFDNVDFYSPDYVQIMASSTSSAYYTNSHLTSGRIAVMTQQNAGGTISIKDSTVDVASTVVQIKSGAANKGVTHAILDNATVNFTADYNWSGTLVELVESDDAGNPGNTTYTISDLGEYATVGSSRGTIDDSSALLKNGEYSGNIWNNIYNYTQALNVTLEKATLNGQVSAAVGHHEYYDGTVIPNGTVLQASTAPDYRVDEKSGDYYYIGAQVNVPNPVVNNPINLTVDADSKWNVTPGSTNYLAALTLASEQSIAGKATVHAQSLTVGDRVYTDGEYTLNGVTVIVKAAEEVEVVDTGILAETQAYGGFAVTFKAVDEEGNNAALKATFSCKANADGTVSFTASGKDGYAVKSTTVDNGTAYTEGNDAYGFAATLAAPTSATVVTFTIGEGSAGGMMPGMPGGAPGGMPGMPGGEMPGMPGGEAGGEAPGGEAGGEMPGGEAGGEMPGGEMPGMPGGEMPGGMPGGMPPGGPGGGASGNTVIVDRITTSSEDNLSSFSGGGWTLEDDDYAYVSALFINGGVIDERSVEEAISAGTYTATEADGVTIKSTYEGFNPIIIHDSKYTIKNADITIDAPQSDGLVTNDFSGYGSAIATYGDSTVLTIEDSKVNVSGVANMTVFTDDGSDVIIKNSQMHSDGGTLHADYKNSPNQTTMVAPPWILGIMGSSRCTNLMGTNSSMTVLDSNMTAAQWAILSTDSGSNMTLNVINSYMGLTGADYDLQADGSFQTEWGTTGATANPYTDKAGYGTYTIGNSNQKFYGVDMRVGTYANIYTGGIGLYTAMKAGETITALDANGVEVTTYTPVVDKVTTINSDTFGFMIHQGSNTLTIEEGTVVNSGYTTFLLKTGCTMDADITSGAVLNPGNGIILQVMDNDDATTGMDVSTFSFYSEHVENPGWPTVGATSANSDSTFTFDDVTLVGDIFNGSGWELNSVGAQTASPIVIELTGDTTLVGQISSTAAIHVTKEGSDAVKAAAPGEKTSDAWTQYQNTSFPIGHYFDIGQVANKVASHGLNTIDVIITDNAKWTVTADGIVADLTAASTAIVADKPVTLTVEGVLTLDGKVVTEDTTVGNVTYKLAANEVETEALDVTGWVVGNVYTGYPDISGATTVPGTDLSVKIIDGNGDGVASEGDAVLQYEASTMQGWLDASLALTTTAPAAAGGAPGGMPGGDMGGMPGGDMPGGPGGGPGGPGGGMPGGGGGASVAPEGQFVVTLDDDKTVTGIYLAATIGSFSGTTQAYPRTATALNENVVDQEIVDDVSWHNGVIFDEAGEWTVSGSTISMMSDADGSDTNDFSGLGAAVMVNGEGVVTNISDSKIEVAGVGKLALFIDSGAITIVDDSEMYAHGGTIYEGYMSTADQTIMLTPPWVLGLGGNDENPCNSRTINLMGNYSVAAYVDSYFYAKGWGALSVDTGTNMNMVVVNSEIDVETSGYGAYNIGESTEDYYGSTMDVATYAIIMTGGEASFQSYTQGQVIDVVQFNGETNEYGHGVNGTVVAQVSSDKVTGTKYSSIVSDNFGFLLHANGSTNTNVVDILDGTSVTTQDAVFLVKKVNGVINVDNSTLVSEDKGVILQIIDNDDDYVGLDFAATWGMDDEYGHTYGSHMPTFNSTFTEAEGYSNEWVAETSASAKGDSTGNWTVEYNMTNANVVGDIWNSTGYVGSNPATTLTVNLGEGAVLTGLISAGAFSHDTKYAEVGDGDWTAADALGHVTNIVNSNGVNLVHVNLSGNAVWNVTESCAIDSLTVSDNAKVVLAEGVTLTVAGEEYHSATTAYASIMTVSIDGQTVDLKAYALKNENGDMTHYVKLRDVAYLLNGTAAQFEVIWDGSIKVNTDTAYTPNGSELGTPFSGNRAFDKLGLPTVIDGVDTTIEGIVLTDDNGGGYTYYQLRDLGKHLGFNVGWSNERGIFVETDKAYTDAN